VARPDDTWGETPCAFVTLKDGATADADEIVGYCRDVLAHFTVPKTSTGKIQKYMLRRQAEEL